jgi:hypothetical protein
VQDVVLAVSRDGGLLFAPSFTRTPLPPGNRFLKLLQEAGMPPGGLVRSSVVRVRQHEQVPPLPVHGFEQRHQVRRFVEHEPIFHGHPERERSKQPLISRTEDRHPACPLHRWPFQRVANDLELSGEARPGL